MYVNHISSSISYINLDILRNYQNMLNYFQNTKVKLKRNTWQAQLSLSPFHSLSFWYSTHWFHSFSSFFSLSKFFSTAVQQQITTCASLQVDLILAGLLGLTAFPIFKMNSTKCPSTIQRPQDCPATSKLPKLKTRNFLSQMNELILERLSFKNILYCHEIFFQYDNQNQLLPMLS